MTSARDNPFRVEQVHAFRTRLDGTDWPRMIDRLRDLGGRGAIVGPHGSGKSTLLQDLGHCLEAAGLCVRILRTDNRRPLARRHLADLRDGECLLLDSRPMSPLMWMSFLARTRRCSAVVVTAHYLTPLPTLYRTRPRPEVLHQMLTALAGQPVSADFAAALLRRHRGNFRNALAECYDRCATGSLPTPRCRPSADATTVWRPSD